MADLLLRDTDPEQFRANIVSDILAVLEPMIASTQGPKLVGRDQMAQLLGVRVVTLDRAVRNGIIPSVKIGARRVFEPEKVISAFKNHGDVQDD